MTRGPLCELVPIENAAMPERTVIQWNKDDLDELGILKVDCLALGMLTAIRKCFALVKQHDGRELTLANIPEGDEGVYAMIRRADTMGVFQIESRAQMSMLPRLAAQVFLRPGDRSGHRPPRPDPGQHGPSLSPPPQRRGGGRVSQRGHPPRAGEDARRAAVPGAGDAAGGRGGRLHARRGRSASPRHGRVAAAGRDRSIPPQAHRRHARPRVHAGVGRGRLSSDPRLRRVWFSRVARRQFRPAGLRLVLAEASLPGRFHRRLAQQPAAGVLRPRPARPQRPRARRGGVAGRCEP